MSLLEAHIKDLYELRFSPMTKPAGEVANLTMLESHTTRGRMMMFWRIAAGIINWGPREIGLLYESTLDSISEAFDVYKYPISQYMLDARADVWEAGLAPDNVKRAVETGSDLNNPHPDNEVVVLAGEIAQLGNVDQLDSILSVLAAHKLYGTAWITMSGALAYSLGARDVARRQAEEVVERIKQSKATLIICDGPETAWALRKIYPALGCQLPGGVSVKLLSEMLDPTIFPSADDGDTLFFHDSRPACLVADVMADSKAVLPDRVVDDAFLGQGAVYEAPRTLLRKCGYNLVTGAWSRSLAKTSGVDDGLWLTYPELGIGLAKQRLDYAKSLGAKRVVTDSPLSAGFMTKCAPDHDLSTVFLPQLLVE